MGEAGAAVPRTALLERAASARVVLLRGPAGSGKSIVAEQLLAEWGVDALRVRIEDRTDRAALSAALARSLRRAGRADDADSLAAAPDDDSIDRFVGLLAGRPDETTIVLDDVHRLEPDAAAGLGEALADLPARCRAIVAGRDLRALADLGRRADSRVFDAEDLVLSAAEVGQLLGDAATVTLVAEVLDATDGWPAAVDLAAARLRREPRWSPAGAGGARALLGDLVAELATSDPALPSLARLPLLDDDVVRLAGGDPATVADLPTHAVGRWRTIAAPVREALLDGAPTGPDVRLPGDAVAAIAGHYVDHGETAAGLRLLHESAPADVALAAIAARRWTELAELPVDDLRAIVDDLSAPDPGAAATLLVEAARAVELTDRPLRSAWLAAAIAATEQRDDRTHRAALAEQARDRFRAGDVEGGTAQAESVAAAAGPDEPVTRARALVTVAMRAAFTCSQESLARAAVLHGEAASLFASAGEVGYQAEALARLGYTALYFAGRPVEGDEAMGQALALLPVGDRVRAFWLTNHADVLDFLGRDVEADAAVREALEIGARRHDESTLGMAWWMKSWLASHRGDATGTKAALAEVERHRGPWLTGGQDVEYLASSAEHLALVGDVVGYREFLERAATVGAEAAYLAPVTLARMWFEAMHGDPEMALSILDELDGAEAVVPSNGPRRLLIRAVALHRAGRADDARATAAQAQAAAEAMGVPDLHARMHRPMLDVLGAAAPAAASATGPAATLRLLGGFSFVVAGDDRTPQPGHPATLVKLLALGGPLTTDGAIDALWPDVDPALGRSRLRNVLNRLKDRSGPLVVRDGDALRLQDGLTVDAHAFEAAAAAALAAAHDERVGRGRNALALYTGTLLPTDMYDDWAAAPRARLQRRFVALADLVADDAVARGDLDEAARLLDLGIGAEPLDEARTVKLCDLLTAQGRTSSTRVVAARCVDLLADLGIEPGPELARHAGAG